MGEGVEAGCPGAVHQAQSSHGGVAVQSPLVAGGGWGGPQAVAFMQAYVQVVNAVRAGSTGTVRQSVDPPAAASPKCISASASAGLTRLESSSSSPRELEAVRQASKRARARHRASERAPLLRAAAAEDRP